MLHTINLFTWILPTIIFITPPSPYTINVLFTIQLHRRIQNLSSPLTFYFKTPCFHTHSLLSVLFFISLIFLPPFSELFNNRSLFHSFFPSSQLSTTWFIVSSTRVNILPHHPHLISSFFFQNFDVLSPFPHLNLTIIFASFPGHLLPRYLNSHTVLFFIRLVSGFHHFYVPLLCLYHFNPFYYLFYYLLSLLSSSLYFFHLYSPSIVKYFPLFLPFSFSFSLLVSPVNIRYTFVHNFFLVLFSSSNWINHSFVPSITM